jgi:type VI secretion system Hcp family effector
MAYEGYKGYVTIHSKLHGPFQGNNKHGSTICQGFDQGVEAPLDIATGHTSGKRQHNPIKITKEWGGATPLLFQAHWTDEVFDSVVIQLTDQNGKPPKKNSRRIHLTNAVVSKIDHIGGGKYSVTFVYEEISDSNAALGSSGLTYHGGLAGPIPMPYPN